MPIQCNTDRFLCLYHNNLIQDKLFTSYSQVQWQIANVF